MYTHSLYIKILLLSNVILIAEVTVDVKRDSMTML